MSGGHVVALVVELKEGLIPDGLTVTWFDS